MKRSALIITALLLAACGGTWQPEGTPELVVEGYIEDGGFPRVTVTTSVPTSTEYRRIDEQTEHLVRWAKVSVSDGDNTVILTGMNDKHSFPPYIYTTPFIRGQAGKAYTLTVEYGGRTATAVTTIPEPLPLDGLELVRAAEKEGAFHLFATFTDPPAPGNRYKFFVKTEGADSLYLSSFLGNFDDSAVNGGKVTVQVRKGNIVGMGETSLRDPSYFYPGEKVHVRFCTLDGASYRFWESFETLSTLSNVPAFTVSSNPEFNVDGGLGYWCGYGASYYDLTVE